MSDTVRDRYVSLSREQWSALVRFALLCPSERLDAEITALAKRTNANVAGLRRKVEAIRYSKATGMSQWSIVEAGQVAAMALHRSKNGKGAAREPYRIISWRVPASLADAVKPDPDRIELTESLQSRLMRVCKFRTSEELWEFFLSIFVDFDEESLKNYAGLGTIKDKFKRKV